MSKEVTISRITYQRLIRHDELKGLLVYKHEHKFNIDGSVTVTMPNKFWIEFNAVSQNPEDLEALIIQLLNSEEYRIA